MRVPINYKLQSFIHSPNNKINNKAKKGFIRVSLIVINQFLLSCFSRKSNICNVSRFSRKKQMPSEFVEESKFSKNSSLPLLSCCFSK